MSSVAVQRVQDGDLKARPIGPRVLIVDEKESMQNTLTPVLPAAGYTVYQVRNGKEALLKVQSVRPDLILLHLGSPDLDGKEVIRHFRERAIAPIIVISPCHEESEKSVPLILALMIMSLSRFLCQSCWRACAQPCAA